MLETGDDVNGSEDGICEEENLVELKGYGISIISLISLGRTLAFEDIGASGFV